MEDFRASHALARASAALVGDPDVAGFLATLLESIEDVLSIDASGVLVQDGDRLDVLAASGHAAAVLELLQAQLDEGPCVDAYSTGEGVTAGGAQIATRWPRVGPMMLGSGFSAVHASPLRWHGDVLGAIGMFRRSGEVLSPDEETVAQAFADLATLLIVQSDTVDLNTIRQRVQDALTARIVVEQAKGVLAETQGLDMAEAYRVLLDLASGETLKLTPTAQHIVDEAQRRVT